MKFGSLLKTVGMSVNNEETLKSPIINGVLCYTSTARHSVRNDDIVRICLVFYKDDIKGKVFYAVLLVLSTSKTEIRYM